LLREFRFIADTESIYDASRGGHPRGALILKGGRHFLAVSRLNDNYGDLIEAPVLGEPPEEHVSEAVGFSRWKIECRDGNDSLEIWSHECGAPK